MPVTSLLAAIFALMLVPLSFITSLRRRELKVAYGDGDDKILRRRIRDFGNFIEYAPMMLIVLAMTEVADAWPALVWALAGAFLVSRICHAIGTLDGSKWVLRPIAMVTQHTAFVVAGVVIILKYFKLA